MYFNLRRKMNGEVVRVKDDPFDSEHQVWVDVKIGEDMKRLVVSQKFRQENDVYEGEKFSWNEWALPLLNFLLINPVQDITKEYPPNR